jgi:putative flippase GtrA
MQATLQLTVRRFTQPLRFGLVGVSGIAVNSAILWALVQRLHMPIPLGSVLATEAAIVSNFVLNDRWTFRAAGAQRSLVARWLRFNGVALGGMAITATILTLLTHYARLDLLIANIGAVGAATIWNYIVNTRWTWANSQSDHVQPPRRQVRQGVGEHVDHGVLGVLAIQSPSVDGSGLSNGESVVSALDTYWLNERDEAVML